MNFGLFNGADTQDGYGLVEISNIFTTQDEFCSTEQDNLTDFTCIPRKLKIFDMEFVMMMSPYKPVSD